MSHVYYLSSSPISVNYLPTVKNKNLFKKKKYEETSLEVLFKYNTIPKGHGDKRVTGGVLSRFYDFYLDPE